MDTLQKRWNEFGKERHTFIARNSEQFRIDPNKFPLPYRLNAKQFADFLEMTGPFSGKDVCEIGCARGEVSVFLAKQGAKVTACDVGVDLVASAKYLAALNRVHCRFMNASIIDLPLQSSQYDIVIGLALLHHLSETDVVKALSETHRILKPNGVAVFYETIENSKPFEFLQNLFPVGERGSHHYRPSILQRRAWQEFANSADERALTNRELIAVGKRFKSVRIKPYGLLIRLERLIGKRFSRFLEAVDSGLFKFSALHYFCRFALIEYKK